MPWTDRGLPRNLITKRPYRGINVLTLSMLGYEHNYFLTFKQVQELGCSVKKGEKSHMVVYWNYIAPKDEKVLESEDSKAKKIPYIEYYSVFNIAQCDGFPESFTIPVDRETQPIPACEKIVEDMPQKPRIQFKEQSAYYDPIRDFVNMPKQKNFDSDAAYYSTFFHELIHSTGYSTRLARKDLIEMSEFGSEQYSHEELVAEIGTCYLQSITGIQMQFEQSAAYIKGWLSKLQNDKKFIFSAARHAQKATDFILNIQHEFEEQSADE